MNLIESGSCDECGAAATVIELGAGSSPEAGAEVCQRCLLKAITLWDRFGANKFVSPPEEKQ